MSRNQNLVVADVPAHPRPAPIERDPLVATGRSTDSSTTRDYLRVIWRHKIALVLFSILGLLIGLLVSAAATPVYRADLKMVVEEERSKSTNVEGGVVVAYPSWRYYETQYEIIRSRLVAEKAIENLGSVDVDQPIDPPRIAQREKILSVFSRVLSAVGMYKEPKTFPPVDKLDNSQRRYKREFLVNTVLGSVDVSGGDDTQIVNLTVDSIDPVFAADVANAVAQSYIDLRMQSRVNKVEETGSWLGERVSELRRQLTESEVALQQYRTSRNIIDLKSQEAMTESRLSLHNQAVVEAQNKVNELAKRYGGKHPKLAAARRELGVAQSRLKTESNKAVDTQKTTFELAALEREVEANRELYELFLQRFKQSDLSRDYDIATARVVDRARPQFTPIKPHKARMIVFFSALGLLLGALVSLLRESMNNKFKSFEDIESELRLPVLGVVPQIRKGIVDIPPERSYLADTTSPFAESLNHIRTGVLFSDIDNPPKVVLITSAVQGEGKTTLVTNLALSFSQLGRTLLIDTDLRKPRIGQVTGFNGQPGLVELLSGKIDMQAAVRPDKQSPNLFVLPAGSIAPNPLQLLSSPRFAQLLKVVATKFDHVLLDAAPVLPVSDAIVVGRMVDGILLAVRAENTGQSVVKEAVKRLATSNVVPRGIVLTQLSMKNASYYGGDYYSRYYSYYSDRKPPAESPRLVGRRRAG